jgi:hypothetical protein
MTTLSPEEIVQRGQERYEREIRAQVEAKNKGRFLALDIETGAYEMDEDDLTAEDRLLDRMPHATVFALRIGYPAAYRLGAIFR